MSNLARHTLNFTTPSGTTITSLEIPDVCPHCKRLVVLAFGNLTFNRQREEIQAVFFCSYQECAGIVMGYYSIDMTGFGRLKNTEPPLLTENEVPDFAKELSPNFVSIYKEASEAQARGLEQIAGPGFRKAGEFLIKDYAKSLITETDEAKKQEMEKAIETKFVGKVVDEFIGDIRVQKVARRVFWIGNDETHYLRKWTDKDIGDLLTLIKLTLDWMEIERLSAKYEDDMPDI